MITRPLEGDDPASVRRCGYNRGASHPVNAMLNYAYGVLIARLQLRLVADGYDGSGASADTDAAIFHASYAGLLRQGSLPLLLEAPSKSSPVRSMNPLIP
jgi:hypothetical protein